MTRTPQILAAAALLFLNFPATGFGEYAFVWANNPTTSSYVPSIGYQHNSTGAINTITRLGRGRYRVLMPNVQPKPYGNVQVTAYGYSTLFCNVGGWSKTGVADLSIDVYCFDTLANPADSRFTAIYHDKRSNREDLAYAFTDRLISASFDWYYGTPRYSHNSEWSDPSTAAQIWKLFDDGQYIVYFPGWESLRQTPSGLWDTAPGNLQLTTVDREPNRCVVTNVWHDYSDPVLAVIGTVVNVNCFTPIGAPVDTRFALAYSRDRVLGTPGTIGAYVNVDDQSSIGSVPWYLVSSFNSVSPFAIPVVTHVANGQYRVVLPQLARVYSKSTVLVTAKAENRPTWETTYCKVAGWSRVGEDVHVDVHCYSYSGLPRHSAFNLNFVTDASY